AVCGLVARRLLADERIDVGVLEQCGEAMAPRLQTRRLRVADGLHDPYERDPHDVGLDDACIPPHPLGDLLGLRPRERLAIYPPRLRPFVADAGQLAAATDQRRRLGCRVCRENRIKSWKPRIMWKVWNGG